MQPVSRTWSHPRRRFLALLLITLSLYVLVPQVDVVRQSLGLLRSLQPTAIAGALLSLALTFPLAASSYHFLARRRLIYRRTILIALANMFTNRLLPAGAGSIATFFVYLRKRKHTVNQATSVVAVNNFIGFISHGCLLAVLLVFDCRGFSGLSLPAIHPQAVLSVLVVVVLVVAIAVGQTTRRQRVGAFVGSLSRDLLFYRRFPLRLTGTFVCATLLTIANAVTLWYCLLAVHGHIGLLAALAVFTIGIVAGTLTPTPGGLGGTEAGLLAGLIGYHVAGQTALAAVVLYRLITYWLTLALGAVSYIYVENRGYLHRFEPAD